MNNFSKFDEICIEILKDLFDSALIDWSKNLYENLDFSHETKMLRKPDLEFSKILIFNHCENSCEIFEKVFKKVFEKNTKKQMNELEIKNAIIFQNSATQISQNESLIFYKKNDWPFELSSKNFIFLYFFFDAHCHDFQDENEVYKFLTLCFYTLKEKSFFSGVFFGNENLKDLRVFLSNFFKNNKFQEKKIIDFQKMLHNLQKTHFKDPLLLNEKFSFKFDNFKKFFDFVKSEKSILKILFSEDEIHLILKFENDLTKYLNQNYKTQKSENNQIFEIEFEIFFFCAWS